MLGVTADHRRFWLLNHIRQLAPICTLMQVNIPNGSAISNTFIHQMNYILGKNYGSLFTTKWMTDRITAMKQQISNWSDSIQNVKQDLTRKAMLKISAAQTLHCVHEKNVPLVNVR